jgi:hypothetical protein
MDTLFVSDGVVCENKRHHISTYPYIRNASQTLLPKKKKKKKHW